MNPTVLDNIKPGLILVLLCLMFAIGLGVAFGINEDLFQDYITQGIAAHPALHDESSPDKIWRYVQRAHFHAGGVAAFSLGLLFLVAFSSLSAGFKKLSSVLIGLGSFYPFSWFTMFFMAPALGRDPSHGYWLTEVFTYVGVLGLCAGLLILLGNLMLGLFGADQAELAAQH